MRYRNQATPRPIRQRILILCEGEKTEPTYFNSIKSDKMRSNRLSGVRIIIHHTKKNTARELVDEAISLKREAERDKNPYDAIWVAVDKDGYTKHPESFDRARARHINIAFSSVCFEYWILLHFEYTTAAFANCDAVINRLRNHIADYEKNENYYDILRPNTETAITRSDQVKVHWETVGNGQIWTLNPYTNVGDLVRVLIQI